MKFDVARYVEDVSLVSKWKRNTKDHMGDCNIRNPGVEMGAYHDEFRDKIA